MIYAGDSYKRLMWGVISDSRTNIPAVKNQVGAVIKAYVDMQISLVTPDVLPYKIETGTGNLVGYFGLYVGPGSVSIQFQQLRPAFVGFSAEISTVMINFILSGAFKFDTLN